MDYSIGEVVSKFDFEDYFYPFLLIVIGVFQLGFGPDIFSVAVLIIDIFFAFLLVFLSYHHAKTQLRIDEIREQS